MKKYIHLFLIILAVTVGTFFIPNQVYATDVNEQTVNQSADNSLDILKISDAELSPEFYYSRVKYTATVPYDVTEVEVTARASHPKATIDAITGNENLSVGENKIKITVTAENGNKAVYTITLTRLAEGDNTVSTETNESQSEEIATPDTNETEDGGEQVDAVDPIKVELHFGEASLNVYAAPEELVKDYMVFSPLVINDVEIAAYRYEEGMVVKEVDDSDLYLLYGEDNTGITGWFEYDSRTGVFQRYVERFVIEKIENPEPVTEEVVDSSEYADLLTKYNTTFNENKQLKQKIRMMTYVFLFIVVILLIIIFSIMWSKRDDDYEDGDVFEDEPRDRKKKDELFQKEKKEIEIIAVHNDVRKEKDDVSFDDVNDEESESIIGQVSDTEPEETEDFDSSELLEETMEEELPVKKKAFSLFGKKKKTEDSEESDDIEFLDL